MGGWRGRPGGLLDKRSDFEKRKNDRATIDRTVIDHQTPSRLTDPRSIDRPLIYRSTPDRSIDF